VGKRGGGGTLDPAKLAKICPDGAPDCQGPPNGGIAAPALDNVNSSGAQLIVQGHLQGNALSRFTVELFANQRPGSDADGETLVGEVATTTDAGGHAKFTLIVGDQVSGSAFTATATSSDGATSEFSPPISRPK